ncbi:MAG: TatD family hydrolase, partial [Candidatus Poribacteria bacterium]|nr:TatD family hydrolase [Candidatus Poribacteria bacterium]
MKNPHLFDIHAHLQLETFDADRDAVLERAREAGVETILNVGFSIETTQAAIDLAERHDGCWATAGLRPHDAKTWNADIRAALRDLSQHPKVIAIGEGGLDYYRNLSPKEAQFEAFIGQIELARET